MLVFVTMCEFARSTARKSVVDENLTLCTENLETNCQQTFVCVINIFSVF